MQNPFTISATASRRIESVSLALLSASLVLPIRLLTPCIVAFVTLNFYRSLATRWSDWNYPAARVRSTAIALAGYFALCALSYFWSENPGRVGSALETKSTLIVLPAAFVLFNIRTEHLRLIQWAFTIAVTSMMIVCFTDAIVWGLLNAGDFITPFRYYNFVFSEGLHPSYFSVLILISLTFINDLWQQRTARILLLLLGLFQIFSILFIGARVAIILLPFVLAFVGYDFLKHRGIAGWKTIVGGVVVCMAVFLAGSFASHNSLARMMTASESIHERLGLYDVALHTFLEKPLLGFGVEGADETLVAQYTALGMMDAAESNYNPHNQYLQTLVELGLLGACVFLLLLVVIIRNGMPRALTIRVFVVFLLFFVVESALQRLPGIASFTAFAMIFASINSKEAQGD